MSNDRFAAARWRKSSSSGDGGCVEVALTPDVVGVRDTKAKGLGPVLAFDAGEWRAFVGGAVRGDFRPGRFQDQ